MQATIKWNIISPQDWHAHFKAMRRTTVLQSYAYARGCAPLYGQKPRWGLIEIDDRPAGLVQVMEASILGGMLHGVILDRGPLWLPGYGEEAHIIAFIEAYSRAVPKRFGRRRRFLPEWEATPALEAALRRNGWRKTASPAYETQWLDVSQTEGALRAALRKSWRQSLVKAEKSPISIEWEDSDKRLPLYLKRYVMDKNEKGYSGPDVQVLRALGESFGCEKNMLTGTAFLDKKPIAGILILCHGQSATYQIGWSDSRGRQHCAHHRLLWEGALALKKRGIMDLDLGGVNETSAKTIKRFKQGMGGQSAILAGLYI